MILTFRRPQVERLLAHTRAALMHLTLYIAVIKTGDSR